ncbi:MAG: glycoside hydrolase family 3 C-terminal domain-containing protein, partial [Sandaracinobacteroides sp.]
KFKLGLMGPVEVTRGNPEMVGAATHLALAREAVAKSLVLLKNDDRLLPIRPGARVLIAGPGADSMAMQAGGWTISWQGTDTKASDFPNGQTIGQALARAVTDAGGQAMVAPDGAGADRPDVAVPDVAVIVMGENPYAEFQGDIAHLAFQPRAKDEALIARLRAEGVRIVVLFLSGRPLFTGPLLNQADAFVAAWLPGTQADGIADVLVAGRTGTSARDFTGRLSFAWPADARAPVAAPLFPVGFGLSYAHSGRLGPVNEDPKIDLRAFDNRSIFFRRGVAPAPWFLASDGVVSARAVDLSAQEDARQFSWTGRGKFSLEGTPVDLTSEARAGASLLLDWRVDSRNAAPVRLSLGGAALDITGLVAAAPLGAVTETRIPLRCFAAAGAKLSAVGAPLQIDANTGFTATIRNARIAEGAGQTACPAKAR